MTDNEQGKHDAELDIAENWVSPDDLVNKAQLAQHLKATIGASDEYIDAYYAAVNN